MVYFVYAATIYCALLHQSWFVANAFVPTFQGIKPQTNLKSMQMNFLDNLFGNKEKASDVAPPKEFTVAVTGSSGMVGSALSRVLQDSTIGGAPVTVVPVRRSGETAFDLSALEGVDAVVHLAGENVASGDGPLAATGRWTESKKEKILNSRMEGTTEIAEAIASMSSPPKVLVCASAIGYYGYTKGAEELDEASPMGDGFLAQVCEEWEKSSKIAAAKTRVVNLRLGVVLSKEGGALAKLLPIFQLAAGGNLGDGKQYFSWVSLRDAAKGIKFALENESLSGPVNLTAPKPVTNAEFTAALGKALSRPAVVPVPEFAGKIIFGQMGEEMLFGGQNVVPSILTKAGFEFEDPDIDGALSEILC